MATDLVKVQVANENELDRVFDGSPTDVEGVDSLGREDMSIPRLELVQAQSDVPDADAHLGQWYNTLTGEYKKTVKAVLLSLGMGRAAFPRDFSRDSEPLCASDDGILPRAEFIGTLVTDTKLNLTDEIRGECATCVFSRFGPNGESPLCPKAYVYAMLDVESGLPFVVRMQRSATKAAKQINTIAKMQGRKKLIVLASKKVTSDTGNYYEPIFMSGEATPPEMLALCYQLTSELGNIAARVQRERSETNGNGNADLFEQVTSSEPF